MNDIREFMGLNDPQAIYHWQNGKNLPSVDHLCALAKLFGVSMDEILVIQKPIVDSSRVGQKKEKAILSHVLQCCLLQAA